MGEGQGGGEGLEGLVVEDVLADLGIIAAFSTSVSMEEMRGC